MMLWHCVAALASGIAVELLAVLWVDRVGRRGAFSAALVSAAQATATVVGIGESVQHGWAAAAFVFGYGLGSYLGVRLIDRA